MKLNPRQLNSHLSSGVAPVYLVSGDEPLLVDEVVDEIRVAARKAGCEERELYVTNRGFDWQSLGAGMRNMSLFTSRRLIEVRLPTGKPGDKGSQFIVTLADRKLDDTITIFITPALDSRTAKSKWASTIARQGVWVAVRSLDYGQIPAWITERLHRCGLTIDDDALEMLTSRVEGNLLAAKQEIDKLLLIASDGQVTLQAIQESVADGARYDVFQLADAALAGNAKRALRILHGLRREAAAPPLVLWSLAREITILADVVARMDQGASVGRAMQDAKVWSKRQDLIRPAATGRDLTSMRRLVACAAVADRIIKGARYGQTWDALTEITLALAGSDRMLAETA